MSRSHETDMALTARNVRYWHKVDMDLCTAMSAFGGKRTSR